MYKIINSPHPGGVLFSISPTLGIKRDRDSYTVNMIPNGMIAPKVIVFPLFSWSPPHLTHSLTAFMYCTVLYCTVLYCTVLYCTVLYCTVLYCTVLYCTVLYCTVLYCTVLYCTVLYYTVLYCTAHSQIYAWIVFIRINRFNVVVVVFIVVVVVYCLLTRRLTCENLYWGKCALAQSRD